MNEEAKRDIQREKMVFLAEDDPDDRLLFEDALNEIGNGAQLITAKDGMQLIQLLNNLVPPPPEVIFLDLNMPRKNGFECLKEIKLNPTYKNIPVVIFSTSSQPETVASVYKMGANFYIRKPGTFQKLKSAIMSVLSINWLENSTQPAFENFLLEF